MRWGLATVAIAACFAPRPPAGAACAANGDCPNGLTCIASTCELPGTVDRDAAPDTPIIDAHPDATPAVASFELIGSNVEAAGSAVTAAVNRVVPAGSLLVVVTAGRGKQPLAITDSGSNSWKIAIELGSLSQAESAGIGYAILPTELASGATITATFEGTQVDDRGIAIVLASGVSALDQVGSAATPQGTTAPSATTPAPTGAPELVFGVIAAGSTQADTITPTTPGFTTLLSFASALSSACLGAKVDHAPAGGESYAGSASAADDFAVAVATFK